ncbi:hypothetical protein KO489_02280 [Reinekea forsetii]|nr:hypothetical protein [Reinekea forsetii]
MAPDGIKLPSDTTVASQGVRRNASAPLESTERTVNSSNRPPPNPLATIVLQSIPIIEGQKGGLFQLILQNDPKSEPPIKVVADSNIKLGTPLLVELDENGQYQPADRLTQAQITKLVTLELEFWQAHLYPKAAVKTSPTLPSAQALEVLAKNYPELKPLVQWLTQRPSQLTGQQIQKWLQEFSPLSVLRENTTAPSSKAFNLATSSTSGHSGTAPHNSTAKIPNSSLGSNLFQPAQPTQPVTTGAHSNAPLQPLTTSTAFTAQPTTRLAPEQIQQPPVKHPILTLIGKITFGAHADTAVKNTKPTLTNSKETPLLNRNESIQSAVFRAKQLTPMIGLNAKALPTNIAQLVLSPNITSAPTFTQQATQAPGTPKGANEVLGNSAQALTASLPSPTQQTNVRSSAFTVFKQISSDLFSTQSHPLKPSQSILPKPVTDLIEVKLSQWIGLIEQTQTKTQADLSQLLKSKAMALINEGQSAAEKIQIDPKLLQSQATKDDPLSQLRSWLESAQAKVFHQAVQSAATQWQLPELPPVQQLQLPLIWLGLTSWADIEWWQEKKKNQASQEKEERDRRWRMRIYLNVDPLSEFCADIDWHSNDTQLVFWSEDAATLSHLNQLIPTLTSWTQGLSDESVIQTRHGMPKKVSKQQLQQTNHHLVDIKT